MKTLNIYVTKSFIIIFISSIGILTFGLIGANLIKVFDYLARGIPIFTALKFLLYILPFALALTIPFSVLVSVMLLFGRMSADNEITAMRACGISILQIISPILIITFLLTCLCLYLQVEIAPRYYGKAEELVKNVVLEDPLAILEPGRTIQYENKYIYINERTSDNTLKGIQLFWMTKDKQKVKQDVTAARGKIEIDKERKILRIILQDVTIIDYSGKKGEIRRSFCKEISLPLDYGKAMNKIKVAKKTKHLCLREIFARTIVYHKLGIDTTRLEIELNRRIALALSPIAFLLLGMPLSIRTSRRETSVGLFLSVILAGAYFVSVMIFNTMYNRPGWHPEILLWIPNILYQTAGAYFLYRIARV